MMLRRSSTGQQLLAARFQSRCRKKKKQKRAETWRQHLRAGGRLASLPTKRAGRRRQAWERAGAREEQRALLFPAMVLLSRRCPIARCHPRLPHPLAITNTSLFPPLSEPRFSQNGPVRADRLATSHARIRAQKANLGAMRARVWVSLFGRAWLAGHWSPVL